MNKFFSCLPATLAVCMLVPLLSPQAFAESVKSTAASSAPAPTASILQDIPALKPKITIQETNRPIDQALSDISAKISVDLIADAGIGDQRVTLSLTDQPVYTLMARLVQLLSHSADGPHGYHWEPVKRSAGEKPAYRLWRDLSSRAKEKAALAYPSRELLVLLRDMRNLARLSPEERKNYKGDYPYTLFPGSAGTAPFGEAMKSLTDQQLQQLADGESIPLDPAPFAGEIAKFRQGQIDDLLSYQHVVLKAGLPDPFKGQGPHPAVIPPSISVTLGDGTGEDPWQVSMFDIHLNGILNYALGADAYDTIKNRNPGRLDIQPPKTGDKIIDLTSALTGKGVTDAQRSDLGFTLQALSKATGINLYEEAFLWSPPKILHPGLTNLKGTAPQIIAAICGAWNYHAEKIGADYLLWSRTWAQDRATDVPERLIAKWRARIMKQNGATLNDRAEMAASLTWPQVKLTLEPALPEAGPWNSLTDYKILRLIGRIPASDRAAAFSPDGISLANMAPWEQEELINDFQSRMVGVTNDQLSHASLIFTIQQDGPPSVPTPIERIIMSCEEGGHSLFSARTVVDLGPAQTPGAQPIASAQ